MHKACGTFPNENCLGILVGKGAEPIKMPPQSLRHTPVDGFHQERKKFLICCNTLIFMSSSTLNIQPFSLFLRRLNT
jgi:hypothetical protein